MSWIASLFVALLTAVLGLCAAGFLANACVSWYRISSFEGKSGYFVVFNALLGGCLGFVIGLIACRLVVAAGAAPGFLKGLGLSWGITLGIAGIVTLIAWARADIPPKIDGQSLDLAVEIRLPVGETNSPTNVTGDTSLTLGSVMNHVRRKAETGTLKILEARFEAGRWIIPGSVYLFTGRGLRALDAELGGKSVAGFVVPLPARPGKEYEQWSNWGPQPPAGNPPWPDTKPSFRFRVVRRIPPPPSPDAETVEAEEFAALKPDAPLRDWLRFLQEDAPAERTQTILKIAGEHPLELAMGIRSPESSLRELALKAVSMFDRVAPEVAEAVQAEQRTIVEGIKRFNTLKAENPGYADLGDELRSRFSYWRHAWWTVHQTTGVDGRPLLQEIHNLSRMHQEDGFMQEIEVNARLQLEALGTSGKMTP